MSASNPTACVLESICTTFLNLLSYQVTRFRLDTFGHPTEVRVETGYPTAAEAQQRGTAPTVAAAKGWFVA